MPIENEESEFRATRIGKPALIVVRNACRHDSRVLREADTLRTLGYQPLVLAVTAEDESRRHSVQDGIEIMRISPTSPLAWARSRLRALRRRDRSGSAAGPGDEQHRAAVPAHAGPVLGPARSLAIRLHRWARTIDFYRRAIAVVRDLRPTVLHCNDYNTMWVGVAARAIGGTAVVYDAHELWPDRNLRPEPRWWLLACEFLFVRSAHRTITSSPGYAEVMARRYRVSAPRVIRNIPDRPLAASAAAPETSSAPTSRVESTNGATVAYVGALTRNRGLEVSIRALARVPGPRLRLIGPVSPTYRRELADLAESEGIAERIEFAAPVPPGGVVDALRPANAGLALIQPACLSYRLSLPNKLFEYVAAGVPVLASDLPVIGRFVRDNEVGLVTRPDDVGEIAAKLKEILQADRNDALRAAVRRADAEIRWSGEADLLAEIYDQAAAAVDSREGHR